MCLFFAGVGQNILRGTMRSQQLWIKAECVLRARRLCDLSDELGISYSRLTRIVGGFVNMPPGFETDVQRVFGRWDEPARNEGQAGKVA